MSFKICSIGCGAMALAGHGPAFSKYIAMNRGVSLAACCDIDILRAERFKEQFGFERCYKDMYEMLKIERPDAVCLIAPVHLTSELAVRIIELGFPVIMEKPPGRNREETIRIIEAAGKKGIPNRVSFNRRYVPLVLELKRLLSDQSFDIHNIRCDFHRVGRLDADFSTTAIHGIDAVSFILGSKYKQVNFIYQELPNLGPNVTNIFMDCIFPSGATAQLSFFPVAGAAIEHITVSSFGKTYILKTPISGTIDYPGSLTVLEANKCILEVNGKEFSGTDEMFVLSGFYNENAMFFDALRNGNVPSGDVASALQSVEIADCIRNRRSSFNA